jgi:hypothetical protein
MGDVTILSEIQIIAGKLGKTMFVNDVKSGRVGAPARNAQGPGLEAGAGMRSIC